MTNCSYHPDKEAVGACVNCDKMICAECKVMLHEKYYCQRCANETLAEDKRIEDKGKENIFIW